MHINGIAYLMLLIYAVYCGCAAVVNSRNADRSRPEIEREWYNSQSRKYASRLVLIVTYAAWQLGLIKWA